MSEAKALEILKSAILLETRGKAFYTQAAETAQDPTVKEFFQMMAREEISHVRILSDQYKAYKANQKFSPGDFSHSRDSVATEILDGKLKGRISAAGYESAAISAAMAMEERAIKLYAQRAEESTDPEEKALYRWLADWETEHLEMLAKIDREVTETVWNDNSFWPF
jgi:rubrerythrin